MSRPVGPNPKTMSEPLRDQIAATLPDAFEAWCARRHYLRKPFTEETFRAGAEWAAGLVVPQPPNPPEDFTEAARAELLASIGNGAAWPFRRQLKARLESWFAEIGARGSG